MRLDARQVLKNIEISVSRVRHMSQALVKYCKICWLAHAPEGRC